MSPTNDEPQASLPGEYIIHSAEKAFLDYTEKYAGTGNNDFVVPAAVSEELSKKIQQMAVAFDGKRVMVLPKGAPKLELPKAPAKKSAKKSTQKATKAVKRGKR